MAREDLTDLGNSQRFVAEHSDELRFVGSWGKWSSYDGKKWVTDETGRAEHRAKETVKCMMRDSGALLSRVRDALDAAEASGDADQIAFEKDTWKSASASMQWALKSHDAPRIRAIVQLARSAPELAIQHSQLDADPWLLNVENGTVDLRTGELREHRASDLISKLAPVVFDPHATAPTWEKFLARAMGDNEELIAFVRRVTGYALTGVIREHALAFHYGSGANGKSTFVNTLQAMLGDYAKKAPRGLLFQQFGSKHETELTVLFGARLVSCAEVAESATFDEALVKDLTGGDPITARRMREDHWTFSPTHKLWLAGNHKPRVKGADEGIWRRLLLIPWTVTIPEAERDLKLSEKLAAEWPGILNWGIRGCLEWQRDGLGYPEQVARATSRYRDESDPLREFFDWHCVFEPEGRIARSALRARYEEYCKDAGAEPLGAKRFAEGLRRRDVRDGKVRVLDKVRDGWRGIRLMTEAERNQRASEEELSDSDAERGSGVRVRPESVSAEEDGPISEFVKKYDIEQ